MRMSKTCRCNPCCCERFQLWWTGQVAQEADGYMLWDVVHKYSMARCPLMSPLIARNGEIFGCLPPLVMPPDTSLGPGAIGDGGHLETSSV
eukprot:scaffold307750_cov37-Tisochrysis_lutea.AAC.1